MDRTTQQQNFIQTVINSVREHGGGRHFCLRARAGTGKSATVLELVDDYTAEFPTHEVTLCAFGNAAAAELKAKLEKRGHTDWRRISASTIHSLGFGLVKFVFKSKVDGNKVRDLVDAQNGEVYHEHSATICRLVSYAKLEGFGFFGDAQVGDRGAWYRTAEHYDINGFDDTSVMDDVVAACQHIYRLSLAQVDVVDFDDMILFPLVKNLRVKFQKHLLVVDEAQDTGRARQALIRKFVRPDGTLIVVGDDRQGIFGFAGAQSDALDQLISGLSMEVLPLTVCWRCPRSVIREAQALVPDIEWAPDAAEGTVTTMDGLPQEMQPTDAILCRNTAPLVETAYGLLRRGVACKVEGREIGTGLLRMVNRWKVTTIDAFLKRLEDYRAREVQKAQAKGNEAKMAEVNDRCDTLVHLCNVCIDRQQTQLDDVRALINSMFADDVARDGVVTLATYHRSKGREWQRVFLLRHRQLCPSPWAKQDWQKRQEQNLAYVAITRAAGTLVYVS
jgi:DNA helicase II / ATP-dependent DNA helicase PcrA